MSNQPPTSSSTSGMSTSMLIQVGVGVVIAAGIVFWTHSRTSGLQEQVAALTKKVEQYEEILKKQGEFLAQHESALRQISALFQNPQGGMQGAAPQNNNRQRAPPRGGPQGYSNIPPQNQPQRGGQQRPLQKVPPQKQPLKTPAPPNKKESMVDKIKQRHQETYGKKEKNVSTVIEDEDVTEDPEEDEAVLTSSQQEELDNELGDELGELYTPEDEPQVIECDEEIGECDEDGCSLTTSPVSTVAKKPPQNTKKNSKK